MQVTAHPTGTTRQAPATVETRPVRLLVPTLRRGTYFLSLEDTLRASDLGITRHTTNVELRAMVSKADPSEAASTKAYLNKLRDGLRHPRDIDEAREWGFHVPVNEQENSEELDPDPRKRLGWWWVYDPTRGETREQREERYLADQRLVDMKGYARVICRAYVTVKDRHGKSVHFRKVISDEGGYRTDMVSRIVANAHQLGVTTVTAKAVENELLTKARKGILKAMPNPADRAGQSNLWTVAQAIRDGRNQTRLDFWYEFNKISQSGRPRGSKNRPRQQHSPEPAAG